MDHIQLKERKVLTGKNSLIDPWDFADLVIESKTQQGVYGLRG